VAGATVPRSMAPLFEGLENDAETRKLVAATVAAEQCRQLAEAGITEFHFYTLNRADLAYALCHILGLRPDGGRQTADGRSSKTEDR
jgi:methylenetetrahydrofolate reductase (NADPH)